MTTKDGGVTKLTPNGRLADGAAILAVLADGAERGWTAIRTGLGPDISDGWRVDDLLGQSVKPGRVRRTGRGRWQLALPAVAAATSGTDVNLRLRDRILLSFEPSEVLSPAQIRARVATGSNPATDVHSVCSVLIGGSP